MMKTRKLPWIICLLLYLIQIVLLGVVYVLQMLTTKKAGVNHHLRFTRTYWMHNYLTEQNILILSVVLAVIAVVLLVIFFRHTKQWPLGPKAVLLIALLWVIVLLLSLHLEAIQALLVYPFLLLAEGIGLLLSCCNIVIISRKRK